MNLIPTKEIFEEYLSYNKNDGKFTWIKSKQGTPKSSKAGCVHNSGYVLIRFNGKYYRAHMIAWLLMTGVWPNMDIDHINENKSDNRWKNLRLLTRSNNMKNIFKRKNNKSGITGVCWDKSNKRYEVRITNKDKKSIRIGRFVDLIDATIARFNAEIEHGYTNIQIKSSAYVFLNNIGLDIKEMGYVEGSIFISNE